MEYFAVEQENNSVAEYITGARYTAVKLLSRYERSDSYIDKLLAYELSNAELSPQDKGLLTEVVNGVIRWKLKLDWILTGFYHGDYQKCLNIVKNAMRVALYQILFLNRIPVPAAINESVEIVKKIQGIKTAAIVNGVLRNISRNIENVRYPEKSDDVIYYFSIIYSHPKWMIKRWIDRLGENQTEKLLFTNNRRPYTNIRINTLKSNFDFVIDYLKESGIEYYVSHYMKHSILLKTPRKDIAHTELFTDGMITIQDTSATLAASLTAPKPGDTVVDLCSAPGGKSFYIAELLQNQGKVYAIEKYPSKLRFIEEGSERLGITCIESVTDDARTVTLPEQADIVFADVPCSGMGTLSKKPDIKWKREPEDIILLVKLQRDILENAATLVKPGGVLVYSTCTIEPEENSENIMWFLQNHPEFEIDPAENYLPMDLCSDGFMQTYPHIQNMDGAFAARLVKKM